MTRHLKIAFGILTGLMLTFSACKHENLHEEPEVPQFENPFTGINDSNGPEPLNIDPESFLGIYNNILSVKCGSNDGACHHGSFEPDYRTLFSAYNTLVYQAPTKNIIESIVGTDTTWAFSHRVSPGDPDGSWLHYRVTTNDEELGRMPLYDQALPEEQVDNIREWILNGAPDPFGNLPNQASPEPQFYGMLAFENDVNGIRLDTARANILEPMSLPANTTVSLWFGAVDYDANGVFVLPMPLGYNKIKISDSMYNFSGVPEENMSVGFLPAGPTLFAIELPYYHNYTINTADYEPGTIYYMRVYLQGAIQDEPTEFPETGTQYYWQTYLSFVVE